MSCRELFPDLQSGFETLFHTLCGVPNEAGVDQTMTTRSGAAFSTTMTQDTKGSPSQTDASALTAWNPHPILLEGMNVYDLKHFVDHLAVQELYDFSLLLEKD